MSDHKTESCPEEAQVDGNKGGGKKPQDPELKAMGVVDAQLTALSEEQRRRVILWVVMKHRLAGCFLGTCHFGGEEAPTPAAA